MKVRVKRNTLSSSRRSTSVCDIRGPIIAVRLVMRGWSRYAVASFTPVLARFRPFNGSSSMSEAKKLKVSFFERLYKS